MRRAVISVVPPGAKPTIRRAGLDGYTCAHAMRDTAGSAAAPAAKWRNCLRWGSFILHLPSRFTSFDHLVGGHQQLVRHREAERLHGPEIDHQLEFRGLFDWEVGRLGALEDLVHVLRGTTVHLPNIDSVGHQPANLRKISEGVYRRHSEPGRELRDLPA